MDKENFIEEVRSFCNEENIEFSYYYDTDSKFYNIRFKKENKAIRKAFSLADIEYTPKSILMMIIHSTVQDIYDSIRKERAEV